MGRPSKLTVELIEKMANYCRAGAYIETAAAACGIHQDVLRTWLHKGASKKSGIYHALNVALSRAQGEWELRDLSIIDQASMGTVKAIPIKDINGVHLRDPEGDLMYMLPKPPDWKAAAWRLSRKANKRWGEKTTLEHTGADGQPIRYQNLTQEQADKETQDILERLKARGKKRV